MSLRHQLHHPCSDVAELHKCTTTQLHSQQCSRGQPEAEPPQTRRAPLAPHSQSGQWSPGGRRRIPQLRSRKNHRINAPILTLAKTTCTPAYAYADTDGSPSSSRSSTQHLVPHWSHLATTYPQGKTMVNSLWFKWKSLRLPWRRSFLVGEFPRRPGSSFVPS